MSACALAALLSISEVASSVAHFIWSPFFLGGRLAVVVETFRYLDGIHSCVVGLERRLRDRERCMVPGRASGFARNGRRVIPVNGAY
jgi:hypothetical protein